MSTDAGPSQTAALQEPTRPGRPTNSTAPYYVLFFLSGFPALTYQIVWQRALFTFYGVNIESVTVIVTAFMLGLGWGSLAGGRLSRIGNLPLLGVFGAIELGVGLYGVFSLLLFHRVASFTAGASAPKTGLITMGMLLFPTLLMGATLPLLVAHFVRVTRNVGESVGRLYSLNTCGSAVACLLAALFVMRLLGESGAVRMAAALNTIVGCSALWLQVATRKHASLPDLPRSVPDPARAIPFKLGLALCAAAGFVSLAYEILWYRLYSFTSGASAASFALVLACYLGGIAYGSLLVGDLCAQKLAGDPSQTISYLRNWIIWAAVAGFLIGPALAHAVRHVSYLATFPLLFIAAALLGSVFPLVSHAAMTPADEAGSRLSYLYLANILGAAGGSLAVGFLMMDYFSLRTIGLVLLGLGVAPALLLLRGGTASVNRSTAAGLAAAVLTALLSPQLFSQIYERLLYKHDFSTAGMFQHIVETRSGVITIAQDGTVYGGGAYDGRFNTDPAHDSNGIFRAYAISSFHPHPADVLMIGLSSGSWAQVIASNPDVSRLTIIEINPGYLQVIPRYPQVASILHNPKVEIIIDDGRRWLVRNQRRKFDLIVMNTTFNWREHTSNLLSMEFLRLVRLHLKPGGIHYYNTTGSGETQLTGASVFPYALRVWTFLAVSDSPIQVAQRRWESCLSRFEIDGRPVFDLRDAAGRARLEEMLSLVDTLAGQHGPEDKVMETGERIRERWKGQRLITDDNMGTEWR
ncbi:MAG: spermidine synthase [Acidobacteriia bacterium]|nr:spermidine synthase [Terriglobia bacterium]